MHLFFSFSFRWHSGGLKTSPKAWVVTASSEKIPALLKTETGGFSRRGQNWIFELQMEKNLHD